MYFEKCIIKEHVSTALSVCLYFKTYFTALIRTAGHTDTLHHTEHGMSNMLSGVCHTESDGWI